MRKINLIKLKLAKAKFFYGIPLAIFSLEIYSGVILGYFLAKFFAGKETGLEGKIKSLVFGVGKWKIHLHHWICGLIALIFLFYMNFSLPEISFGVLGGLIFQGVFSYSDWYKIVIKQEK
jgi:hypothetical protein